MSYTTSQLTELIQRSEIHDPEVAAALRWLCKFKISQSAYNALKEECDGRMKAIESLQAKIDELMLEYCPDDMTPVQLKNWADHQTPSEKS